MVVRRVQDNDRAATDRGHPITSIVYATQNGLPEQFANRKVSNQTPQIVKPTEIVGESTGGGAP